MTEKLGSTSHRNVKRLNSKFVDCIFVYGASVHELDLDSNCFWQFAG